jgi:hypothetical protein
VFDEVSNMQTLISRHPEYGDLVGRLVALYVEITTKGLENERKESK